MLTLRLGFIQVNPSAIFRRSLEPGSGHTKIGRSSNRPSGFRDVPRGSGSPFGLTQQSGQEHDSGLRSNPLTHTHTPTYIYMYVIYICV